MTNLYKEHGMDSPYRLVTQNVLNPKCITMGELYGEFNLLTQEWTDGLASSIMRAQVSSETEDSKWIIFDGPIDALWIENMNTVLDDNMTLCLANGERIKLKSVMKCIFEVQDLEVASPATVSRLGVLYMTPDDLGWLPYIQTWVVRDMMKLFGKNQVNSDKIKERILLHVSNAFTEGLKFVRKNLEEPIPTTNIQLAASFCSIFESLFLASPTLRKLSFSSTTSSSSSPSPETADASSSIISETTTTDEKSKPVDIERIIRLIDKLVAFSMIWSLGGGIGDKYREQFDEWIRKEFDRTSLSLIQISAKGLVFDYYLDMVSEELRKWEEVVPQFTYRNSVPYSQLVVPTVDTVRYSFVIEKLLGNMKPCFLTGVTGTGKTVLFQSLLQELGKSVDDQLLEDESSLKKKEIQKKLGRLQKRSVMPINIGFSAQTNAKVTQLSIEAKLEKKRKTLLGAPAGQSAIIFVDDVNMPMVEEYGAQPPIELLRQFLDYGGFYDREKLFFKDIQDTVLAVSAAPPGGGRNAVTPRFVRHFNVLCFPPASQESMQVMFEGILSGYLNLGFPIEVKQLAGTVIQSTIEVYFNIAKEMLPTPQKSHYTFNLRDLSKVIQGILMIQPNRCVIPDTLIRLWAHECLRVFHDRLINMEDKQWFKNLLLELIGKNFKLGWTEEEIFGSKSKNDSTSDNDEKLKHPPLLFVDFLRGIADDDDESTQDGDDDEEGGEEGNYGQDNNFMRIEERPYEEVLEFSQISRVLEEAMDDYNMMHPTKMNLVFFRDAIEHVSRISRILRQKRGNAMLVGVGGSGKQSLSRLSMFMCGMKCVQIEITKGYGANEFREDIKKMMITAGVGGKKVGFLFTDSQIIVEDFLEDINNILNSGEVPNLFPQDELDRIVADMGPVLRKKKIPESRANCKQVFVNRVRENLHIVLCMSPVGNALRVWCRQFPSLINCCTIDWFLEWPQSALNSVAQKYLAKVDLSSDETRNSLVKACSMVHTSITVCSQQFLQELNRTVYTTPKSYLDLIELYISMLNEKRVEMKHSCDRLSNGIIKLEETNEMVQQLKEELNKLMPVLEVKSHDAEKLLKEVAQEQAEAAQVKAKVALEEAEVNEKAAQVAVVQEDAQKDLDKAMPGLNDAIKSLDALDKKDITEIKNFIKPPAAVQTVMEAVNVLLGEKADWDTAKKVMSDNKFMDNLKKFDKDNISPQVLKKLKKYVEDPIMSVENVKKVSKAATSLCMWVHAMDVYSAVVKEVGPKRERLQMMNQALAEANAILAEKQATLQAVVDKVNALQAKCDETVSEKRRLANEAENTRARLERAEKLTSGLASEGVRWERSVVTISDQIENLVGDMFLASACVSYYGAFTGAYREKLLNKWREEVKDLGIPCSDTFTLVDVIGNPVIVREWQIFGLPTDEVSTNNALLATRGKRWPLMIDPQTQATKWIKQKEAKNDIECVKMTDADMLRALESAVRNGRPLLIEDLGEQIDPALEPILQKAVFKQNGRTLIRIGDSDVDFDDNFKLYMTTKMPNPHYLPEVCIKVTIINFTVTMDGLEDQLLGTVVRKEQPDIEERKNRLLLSMAADSKQLKDIQDKILKMLSESKGDILDDEELINTLADSKTTSAIITERVEESEKTNLEVTKMRNSYRPVARRGSIIYFVIADLARIDPMYQYSLEYFVKLFRKCIDESEKDANLDRRLSNILDFQNQFIYRNVCRGLFEVHKLLFAFLMTIQILKNANSISPLEWSIFLRGPSAVVSALCTAENVEEKEGDINFQINSNDLPNKFPLQAYQTLCILEHEFPEKFRGLAQYVLENWESDSWIKWSLSDQPQEEKLPTFTPLKAVTFNNQDNNQGDEIPSEFTPFQKLLLVRMFREEKTVFAIRNFVETELGSTFVQNNTTSMEDISSDMDNKTPCIFVLSQGADPTGILLRFAEKRGYRDRLNVISLGQGQGPKAEQLIESAKKTGDWVLLQNCHLAKSWMPNLETIIAGFHEPSNTITNNNNNNGNNNSNKVEPEASIHGIHSMGDGEIHPDFRLYLTSFPASYFPVSVLQNGLKLTNEPPKGLRANIFRSFDTVLSEELLNGCLSKPKEFRKLLFGLCFFHGIIQERRKFGPLGWNIRYEFDDSDLETSAEQLRRFLDDDCEIPWDALCYVTGEINYGGRVTDDWDRRCLMSILDKFYTESILLDDSYTFSPSGYYYAPPDTDLKGYKDYISQLPKIEDPEVFGMHDNANITFQLKESTNMVDTVIVIEPRSAGTGGGATPDEFVSALALKMLSELPQELDIESEAGSSTFVLNPETQLYDPLATFLQQEIAKFNNLLSCMKSSMIQLLDAIKGFVVMSLDLDKMYTKLFNNMVPDIWSQVAYPSLRPLASWFVDLQVRVSFLRNWLQNGEPIVFPLPVFFFPQGFMTGILQTHARKYQVAINSLSFDFQVYNCNVEDIDEKPTNGVAVSGLYMEGARWDKEEGTIKDSNPGEMYSPMMPIHFLPTENFKPDPTMYACPVYKTSTRAGTLSTTGMSTNFVLPIYLPTNKNPQYWVWKGVAFLCNLND